MRLVPITREVSFLHGFPQVPEILYNKGFVVWEWLKTVSLLKSEFIKEIIRPKKLIRTKKNCKKVKKINLLSNIFEFLKFCIEKNIIKKDRARPKTNA